MHTPFCGLRPNGITTGHLHPQSSAVLEYRARVGFALGAAHEQRARVLVGKAKSQPSKKAKSSAVAAAAKEKKAAAAAKATAAKNAKAAKTAKAAEAKAKAATAKANAATAKAKTNESTAIASRNTAKANAANLSSQLQNAQNSGSGGGGSSGGGDSGSSGGGSSNGSGGDDSSSMEYESGYGSGYAPPPGYGSYPPPAYGASPSGYGSVPPPPPSAPGPPDSSTDLSDDDGSSDDSDTTGSGVSDPSDPNGLGGADDGSGDGTSTSTTDGTTAMVSGRGRVGATGDYDNFLGQGRLIPSWSNGTYTSSRDGSSYPDMPKSWVDAGTSDYTWEQYLLHNGPLEPEPPPMANGFTAITWADHLNGKPIPKDMLPAFWHMGHAVRAAYGAQKLRATGDAFHAAADSAAARARRFAHIASAQDSHAGRRDAQAGRRDAAARRAAQAAQVSLRQVRQLVRQADGSMAMMNVNVPNNFPGQYVHNDPSVDVSFDPGTYATPPAYGAPAYGAAGYSDPSVSVSYDPSQGYAHSDPNVDVTFDPSQPAYPTPIAAAPAGAVVTVTASPTAPTDFNPDPTSCPPGWEDLGNGTCADPTGSFGMTYAAAWQYYQNANAIGEGDDGGMTASPYGTVAVDGSTDDYPLSDDDGSDDNGSDGFGYTYDSADGVVYNSADQGAVDMASMSNDGDDAAGYY
jgi:hypothetical protein